MQIVDCRNPEQPRASNVYRKSPMLVASRGFSLIEARARLIDDLFGETMSCPCLSKISPDYWKTLDVLPMAISGTYRKACLLGLCQGIDL